METLYHVAAAVIVVEVHVRSYRPLLARSSLVMHDYLIRVHSREGEGKQW